MSYFFLILTVELSEVYEHSLEHEEEDDEEMREEETSTKTKMNEYFQLILKTYRYVIAQIEEEEEEKIYILRNDRNEYSSFQFENTFNCSFRSNQYEQTKDHHIRVFANNIEKQKKNNNIELQIEDEICRS